MLKTVATGATALFLTALPFAFDGVTPTVSKAHAVIGRPFTPLSIAGVHRRAMRRTFGVGANIGWRGYGYHPVARAAVYGAAAYGAGWNRGWGFNRPLYASAVAAPGWGGVGWNGGWGFNRPLYASALAAPDWGGVGWNNVFNRPLYASAIAAPGWGGGWAWGW